MKLRLPALLTVLALAHGQNITPPVPIHQVQPEWGADLSKSFIEDRVRVEMLVDSEGAPFSLSKASAALPDNVVMALSEWRFRPGKNNGHNAAFTVLVNVPLRRAIDPDVERGFGRSGLLRPVSFSKELSDAIKAGAGLDAAGAAQLEQSLAANPQDINSHATLLAFYSKAASPNKDDDRKGRLEQIAWLVQNGPESPLWNSPLVQLNVQGGPLPDPDAYAQVRELWLHQLSPTPDDSEVIIHAAEFFKVADPERALALRLLAVNRKVEVPLSVSEISGLAALGVTGLDFKSGLPVSAGERMPQTPFAQNAKHSLLSGDPSSIMIGLATVAIAGKSLAKAGHVPEGYLEFCNALLNRAKQIQPAITTTCDPASPISGENSTVNRMSVNGNVQAATLIRKVEPEYPSEAKARFIQGSVHFSATINKEGKISDLKLVAGAFVLYQSARDAVRKWVYKPTLLNGRPVEITCTIDVNFALRK